MADIQALRSEIEDLKAQVAAEQQSQSEKLRSAEDELREKRLIAQRDELKAQLARLRGQEQPTAEVTTPEVPPVVEPAPATPEATAPVADPETANKRR